MKKDMTRVLNNKRKWMSNLEKGSMTIYIKKVRVDELKKVAPNRVKNKQARQRLQLKNGGQKFSFLPLLYESNGSYLN